MSDKINTQPVSLVSKAFFGMGCLGALIGAASAAAKNIPLVTNNEIKRTEALKIVLKESAGVGLATAAATTVVGTVAPRSGVFSILGFTAVTAGVKMLYDKAAYSSKPSPQVKKTEITSGDQKEVVKETTMDKKNK